MRIGLFLLLFPSLAFAIGGCPVGVQLGNVTIATRLPICLKFDSSEFGGCLVNCGNVCVELPLANTKGPVETTGTSCNYSDNGSGNGDSDGGGNTPDEGASGTKPIDGWLDFAPVIGDATGTSVSGAVAKLNKNLGVALRQVVDGTKQDSANLNLIAHSAESLARDMKTSLYHLDRMTNDIFYTKTTTDAVLGGVYKTNEHLQSMNLKMDKLSGSGGSSGGSDNSAIASDVSSINTKMEYAMGMWAAQKGSLTSINNQMSSMLRDVGSTAASLSAIRGSVLSIRDSVAAGGSGGDSGGSSIDYSKMPGTSDNPISVGSASYSSKKCQEGEKCFFDLAAINKKLDDANSSLTDKYKAISEDVKQVFSFNLTGSAEPMECLDLFSFHGKDYTVCPPSADYWQTLAALMMFIFYFVALMIIFKR